MSNFEILQNMLYGAREAYQDNISSLISEHLKNGKITEEEAAELRTQF